MAEPAASAAVTVHLLQELRSALADLAVRRSPAALQDLVVVTAKAVLVLGEEAQKAVAAQQEASPAAPSSGAEPASEAAAQKAGPS